MSGLAALRAWAEQQVAADAAAGRIPPMTPETADRIDAVLGKQSPWRRPSPASAEKRPAA